MSKNDELDIVLQRINDEQDWQRLQEFCECADTINLDDLSHEGKVRAFNIEIRKNYGNTLKSVKDISGETVDIVKDKVQAKFKKLLGKKVGTSNDKLVLQRDIGDVLYLSKYMPDYSEILIDAAKKINVQQIPKSEIDTHKIELLELEFLKTILGNLRDSIVKEDSGDEANWGKIECAVFNTLLEENLLEKQEIAELQMACRKGILRAIQADEIKGFAAYVVIRQLFLAILRYLGKEISGVNIDLIPQLVDIVNGRFLARWGLEVDSRIIFADWRKTIRTVIFIALLRQKQKYAYRMTRII